MLDTSSWNAFFDISLYAKGSFSNIMQQICPLRLTAFEREAGYGASLTKRGVSVLISMLRLFAYASPGFFTRPL